MKVDMSAEAIDRRLRATSDLRDLCLRLREVGQGASVSEVKESTPAYRVGGVGSH
jgi:hypothetical protein